MVREEVKHGCGCAMSLGTWILRFLLTLLPEERSGRQVAVAEKAEERNFLTVNEAGSLLHKLF